MKNPFSRSKIKSSIKGTTCLSQSQLVFKPLWGCAGFLGTRHCFRLLQRVRPSAYYDAISHFNTPRPIIALTIDDGLSRGGSATSMADDVFRLLQKYNAHATFFVCTDYVEGQEDSVQALLDNGHEMGNHMESDKLFYYPKLEPGEFQFQMQSANRILDDLETRLSPPSSTAMNTNSHQDTSTKTRWFRAPQGIMNAGMQKVVAEDKTMKHVMGDCYCDDWCFAQEADPLFADNESGKDVHDLKRKSRRDKAMKQVSNIMLSQVKIGSVAILHMPEKGFRQGSILALEFFLQGIQEKGWSCVNLSEMQQSCLEAEEKGLGGESSDERVV